MSAPVFKKDKVSQTFDLQEIFGVDVSDMPEVAQSFAQIAIEHIRKRTESNEFMPGAKASEGAHKYSDDYAHSLAFKAAGKSKSDVNMELTGDMIATMDVLEINGNSITIGWDDPLQSAKAFNHNTGDTVPKRPFFGLADSEVKDIASKFEGSVRQAKSSFQETGRDATIQFGLDLLAQAQRVEDANNGEN